MTESKKDMSNTGSSDVKQSAVKDSAVTVSVMKTSDVRTSKFRSTLKKSEAYSMVENQEGEVVKHCQGTLRELVQDRDLLINLILMTGVWTITSFTYYLGKF